MNSRAGIVRLPDFNVPGAVLDRYRVLHETRYKSVVSMFRALLMATTRSNQNSFLLSRDGQKQQEGGVRGRHLAPQPGRKFVGPGTCPT